MNMRFALLILAAGSSMSFASDSHLKQLAPIQAEASALAAKVCQPDGADGMSWVFEEVKANRDLEIHFSSYENPCLLLKKAGDTFDRVTVNLVGMKGDSAKDLGRNYGSGTLLIPLKKYKSAYDSIKLDTWGTCYVWLGEESTLKKIRDEYLEPSRRMYAKHWVPLVKKMNMSDAECFNELRLLRGKPLPTKPRQAARLYASGCKTRDLKKEADELAKQAASWSDVYRLETLYSRDLTLQDLQRRVEKCNQADLLAALEDMDRKSPDRGLMARYSDQVLTVNASRATVLEKISSAAPDAELAAEELIADCRSMMLANPLLDGMELVAVRRGIGYLNLHDHNASLNYPGRVTRRSEGANLGVPNLSTHSILTNIRTGNPTGWNSEIVKLSNLRGEVAVTPLYKPEDDQKLITNARLHWDGNRVAFMMGSHQTPMALYELDASTGKVQQLSPQTKDHYVDSCYLPDGNIIVMSTAIMTGLPCEGGSHLLSNMYLLNPETGRLRQLGVDQENSYHATVQEDGRVVYVRYEYTDSAHYFNRILMNMNPDGSNQREIYGSNSVWPTSLFYPQQVPGKPNFYSAVISGHHGSSHMGRLVLFDVQKGRREADGAVQFIGAKDEPVEAVMVDRLYDRDYPKFMYSVPLDAEYYLTMLKPDRYAAWGLYLVDRFDNQTLIMEPDDEFIAWPQVLKKKPLPPVIPSRVKEDSKTTTLYIQDIYEGPGLSGLERGSVKKLSIYAFHYGYYRAASHKYIGIESGWDGRYLLGTVPVNEDGSVMFNVPSMMPISMSALDKNGMALQKMRTWMNPQPGEVLSCVGCHETADQAPVSRPSMAFKKPPFEIEPWYGRARPYSYQMELQPVLDRYCISCHGQGKKMDLRNSFTDEEMLHSKRYSRSYVTLQKFVRRNGPESNPQLMVPTEWHASSSSLIQMLKKGHHGVSLDQEAWDRLIMWIDLNAPFHAVFHPDDYGVYGAQDQWRADSLQKYANLDWNPEQDYQRLMTEFIKRPPLVSVKPGRVSPVNMPSLKGWPFAAKPQTETRVIEFGEPGRQIKSYDRSRAITKTLNEKERLEFVRIPAGQYVMGSDRGAPNETPRIVEIKKPFWMSTTEISNSQLQTFDPSHDSRFADMPEKDQTQRGVPLYTETQPAVRVSHRRAVEFCEWLSRLSGQKITLPTEEQWEWAARAGTATDTWYGDRNADYAKFANLSDAAHGHAGEFTRRGTPQYYLYDAGVNDGQKVSAPVKSYQPNPWGLADMIGNAEEWTSTRDADGNYIVKGGSWYDRAKDATSSVRWGYGENMRLPDLGFRVILEEE